MKTMRRKIYENVIASLGVTIVIPIVVYLVFVTLTVIPGILFGYENPSPICFKVEHNAMTRADYLAFPAAKYACKEGAGLLQPYASDFVDYLNEVPGEKK